MKESSLVSVIIPVYNRFEMAERAINSVIKQNYRPIEVILVDDYSDEIFHFDYKNEDGITLKLFRNKSNIGPGSSREVGRKNSSGEFLAYLDSDDMYHCNFVSSMIKFMRANTDIDMVYCHSKYMSLNGVVYEETAKKTDQKYNLILPTLFTHGRPWHSSCCMRRKILTDSIGPWKPLYFWEDYEYDFRAGLLNNKLGYIPDVLCYVDKESEEKITKDPRSPKKNKNYGMAALNMAQSLQDKPNFINEFKDLVNYHLLKSAAQNLDDNSFHIAFSNIKESLKLVNNPKHVYILKIIDIFNYKIFAPVISRMVRKVASEIWDGLDYKYSNSKINLENSVKEHY